MIRLPAGIGDSEQGLAVSRDLEGGLKGDQGWVRAPWGKGRSCSRGGQRCVAKRIGRLRTREANG